MARRRTKTDKFLLVLKGLAMGTANKVPGVSGGIVAFAAGFYEEFIFSLKRFNRKALLLLLNGRLKKVFTYINAEFLGWLIFGMVVSYFSISKLLDYLLLHFELYVWAVFFGMILGSVYHIAKDFELRSWKNIGFILLGIIGGITLSLLEPTGENTNLWFVFFCGFISVCGMALPGLSGSFILILIGNYVLLLVDAVNALYDTLAQIFLLDFTFLHNSERLKMLQILGSFTLGSITGLIVLSHILGYVLKHFKNLTYALIIGFIVGSLGVVWPWKKTLFMKTAAGALLRDVYGHKIPEGYVRYWPNLANPSTWWAIFFIFVGIIMVIGLAYYGSKKEKS